MEARVPAPARPTEPAALAAYRALVDSLPALVFWKDAEGRYVHANEAFCTWVGRSRREVIGATDHDLHPDEIARQLEARAGATIVEAPGRSPARLRLTQIPMRDHRGELAGMQGVLAPDADGARDEEAFFLKTLLENAPDQIYFKDANSRFLRISRHQAERFGLQDPAEAIGKSDFDFFVGDHAGKAFRDEQEIIRTGVPLVDVEERAELPGGNVRWCLTTKLPLRDASGRIVGTFGLSRDITARKVLEEQLARQALYDPVTKLPNRALFLNRVEHLLRRSARQSERGPLFAVLTLDMDRFKGVNDGLGHEAGDELLEQIARRLELCVRPGDTLARVGGDEFTILVEELRGAADATRVADRIHEELGGAFTVRGTDVFARASIGIALSTSGYARAEEMLRDADTALYRAKANGRARHEVFDSDMHKRAVAQLRLETDLHRAIARDELRLHYQPIVDLARREITGFEALVRWQHPQRGLVPPAAFIPLAEETGLIVPITEWVMKEACRQIRAFQALRPGGELLHVSVNLPAQQIVSPEIVDRIRDVVRTSGIEPGALSVEITESALMQDVNAGAAVLQRLRDLAVGVHIDDFGTGYSSLAYLNELPVDALKIDRSFVARMSEQVGRSEIVRAIVSLAHNLRMKVIAEGVETRPQLEALTAIGCDAAQGYLLARPAPADDIIAILASGRSLC